MGLLPPIPWGTLATVLFLGYIANAMYTMYTIYKPPECSGFDCIKPAWRDKIYKHQLVLFTSTEKDKLRITVGKHQVVYNDGDFDLHQTSEKTLDELELPISTRRNGTLFLHAFLDTRESGKKAKTPIDIIYSTTATLHTIQLSRYAVPKPEVIKLIGGDTEEEKAAKKGSDRPQTHLPTSISVCIMGEPHALSSTSMFPKLAQMLRLNSKDEYYPLVFINEAAVMTKDLEVIRPTTSKFSVKMAINQITIGKFKFLAVVEQALQNMEQMGISEQDTDGVKSIFFDTSLFLLLTTILVSSLHMIFDVMALKNDVSFWRKIDKFEGISVRTIGWRAFSQIIILIYLYDNDTSRLVLLSNFASTVLELWKFSKAMKLSIKWRWIFPIGLSMGQASAAEKETDAIDSQGMKLLSYVLWPLCFGGSIYSLYYQPHKSWYSWTVASLANGVYGFGFLLMLPQLFLNYRLKSVAHLPWKVFMYKAFNTFIDDLFAFIIHMPTAHRVACFRDDAVFLVFLYQRWLYPVDKSRRNEFGESFEDSKKIKDAGGDKSSKSSKESKKKK